jgi:hypothetical protein
MLALFVALLASLRSAIHSRLELEAEILALRHQLAILQRQAPKRPRLGRTDRAQATVAKYLGRRPLTPSSQTWRTFLTTQVSQLASIDFFTVPTATFRVLFVFVVLSHDRRRVVHVNVTAHPTAVWTAQQLREAWPWDEAPRFVIRDRDRIDGGHSATQHRPSGSRRSSSRRDRLGRRATLHTAPPPMRGTRSLTAAEDLRVYTPAS